MPEITYSIPHFTPAQKQKALAGLYMPPHWQPKRETVVAVDVPDDFGLVAVPFTQYRRYQTVPKWVLNTCVWLDRLLTP